MRFKVADLLVLSRYTMGRFGWRYFLMMAGILLVMFCRSALPQQELARHGRSIDATVVEKVDESRKVIRLRYELEGNTYMPCAVANDVWGAPDFRDLQPKDTTRCYFLQPGGCSLGAPSERITALWWMAGRMGFALLLGMWAITLCFWLYTAATEQPDPG